MSQPKIIALANPKGGVSKSNTSRTLAAGLTLGGYNVAIGETDPNNTLLEWSLQREKGENPPIKRLEAGNKSTLIKSIAALNSEHENLDFIVIDGCASDFQGLNSVLNICDLVIIPTQSSPDDLIQLAEILELVFGIQLRQKSTNKPLLMARTLITRARLGTALLKQTIELLENTTDLGVYRLKTIMREYESIKQAAAIGKSAFECGNKNAKADAQQLTNEILELFK